MPRGRDISGSPAPNSRRRTSRIMPSRTRNAKDSSSDDSRSPRRPIVRRRSPPRRPRSPVRTRRPRVEKSSGSSASSASGSRHRSTSSSSSSRSRSSSRSTSTSSSSSRVEGRVKRSPIKRSPIKRSSLKRSPIKRSPPKRSPIRRSPVRKVSKVREASPRRSERLPPRRFSPDRRSPIRDRKQDERPLRQQPERQKVQDRPIRQSPPVSSRFHNRRSYSRSKSPVNDRASPKRSEIRREIEHERKVDQQKVEGTLVHVSNITRNVREPHLREIFEIYGKIVEIDVPMYEDFELPRGYARIRYEKPSEAKSAKEHMNGGQIDGQVISVEVILAPERHNTSPAKRHRIGSNGQDRRNRRLSSRSASSGRIRSGSSSLSPPTKRR